MKLLFLGDLAQTGFGTVTYALGKALLDAGVDIRFCSLNEPQTAGWWHDLPEWIQDRAASFDNPDGWLVYGLEGSVEKVMGMFTGSLFRDGWTPDAALILGDPGSLEVSPVLDVIPEGMPVWNYVPIEGIASPPAWQVLWQQVEPIAMSRFGSLELQRLLGRPIRYIHHGVNTDIFHPPSKERPLVVKGKDELHVISSRKEAKEFYSLDPSRTLILRVDRNMPRKRYPSLMRGLFPAMAKHQDVDFWWHCRSVDQGGNMFAFRSHMGSNVGNRMQPTGFHDEGKMMPAEMLAVLYAAADLYVSVSAEGFGLTIAEAMACGTPVVAMDYSAVSEVVGEEPQPPMHDFRSQRTRWTKNGVLVPPAALVDTEYGNYWASVNEREFATAVMQMVEMTREERRQMGLRAALHVQASFSWQRAAQQFLEIAQPVAEVAA